MENVQVNSRVRSLSIVLGAFLAILLIHWVIPLTPVSEWQQALYWNYAGQTFFFAVPLAVMVTARRAAAEYGLSPRTPNP